MLRAMSSGKSRLDGASYSVEEIATFLKSFLPKQERDVPFFYHVPKYRKYVSERGASQSEDTASYELIDVDLTTTKVANIVLSITPTPGVYTALNKRAKIPALAFLHRPFGLDRHRVRRGSTVISSHVSFDQVLTVGYNTVLAARLSGLPPSKMMIASVVEESREQYLADAPLHENSPKQPSPGHICLKGYKEDCDRRIGLVCGLQATSSNHILDAIKHEFGQPEAIFGFGNDDDYSPILQQDRREELESLLAILGNLRQNLVDEKSISCLAIMNAFHQEEVDRVIAAARKYGYVADDKDTYSIIYLTGAPRVAGLTYALQKGLKVACVGHRACEEWGIRYLASELRRGFPRLQVEEVYEDEELLPPRSKKQKHAAAASQTAASSIH